MFITDTDAIRAGMLVFAPHIDGERLYFGRAGGCRWIDEKTNVRFRSGKIASYGNSLTIIPQFFPVLYALPTRQAERQFLHRVHVAAQLGRRMHP